MWTRRLRCPHCDQEFDYEFTPGASATAIRLGRSRYMRCPLCHRFGLFPLDPSRCGDRAPPPPSGTASHTSPVAPSGAPEGAPGEARPVPRFRDRRSLVSWGVVVVGPAMVLIVSGVVLGLSPGTLVLLAIAGIIYIAVGSALFLVTALPNRVN